MQVSIHELLLEDSTYVGHYNRYQNDLQVWHEGLVVKLKDLCKGYGHSVPCISCKGGHVSYRAVMHGSTQCKMCRPVMVDTPKSSAKIPKAPKKQICTEKCASRKICNRWTGLYECYHCACCGGIMGEGCAFDCPYADLN